MSFYRDKKVLVTGGSGFIGSHLVERLVKDGAAVRVCGRNQTAFGSTLGTTAKDVEFVQGDLACPSFAKQVCRDQDMIFHLAANVAGVGYNSRHPATLIHDNTLLGLNILEGAVAGHVERILLTSSACVYRRDCTVPTRENEGFDDDPEPTNFGYGWAKRFLEVQGRCYADQHGLKVALPRPYNAYGPRDDFDWETSHVISALIRKVIEGHDPIVVWGDGKQTRSFLYATDFVEGLLLTLEQYADCDPINIASTEEVTIGELVTMLIELTGSPAKIEFDISRPTGQPRRAGDASKAARVLGFEARVPLKEGLRRTITWYKEHHGIC